MNSTSLRAPLSLSPAGWLRSLNHTLVLGVLAVAGPAQAHPGHGLHDATLAHVLGSPNHLAVLALVGGGLFAVARLAERELPRRVLQAGGAAALVCAVVLWGVRG